MSYEVPTGRLTDQQQADIVEHMHVTDLHRLLDVRPVRLDPMPVIFSMPVAQPAFNSSGNLHGGSIATLIDVAAGTAAGLGSKTFVPGENSIVTADMHIRYLGRPRGDTVEARAQVMRSGRQLVVVECRVVDPQERLIAIADFAAMVVPLRQPLEAAEHADMADPDI